jgi:hypothetical protein
MATLLHGGMLPQAHVYAAAMHPSRALLRRPTHPYPTAPTMQPPAPRWKFLACLAATSVACLDNAGSGL